VWKERGLGCNAVLTPAPPPPPPPPPLTAAAAALTSLPPPPGRRARLRRHAPQKWIFFTHASASSLLNPVIPTILRLCALFLFVDVVNRTLESRVIEAREIAEETEEVGRVAHFIQKNIDN
jgi:hypothetical protein